VDTGRSISTVLSDIVGDLQQIVRAEVRLAKVELREELGKAKRGAVLMSAGGVALIASFGLFLLAAVYGLATIWPAWVAALVVGGAVAVIGAGFAIAGRSQIRAVTLPPEKTVATVKENFQWAKTRVK
jgi:uncharacterized membrane protein YqjE